ncbi:hypothetical protein JTB14_013074 [Gonioctena quinquepunctata]|nr:hypothetical protein JTB14_013074 [Gonioctena quinquepunctata]
MNNQTPTHRTVAQPSKLKLYNTQNKKKSRRNRNLHQTMERTIKHCLISSANPMMPSRRKSRASVSKEDLASIEKQMLPAKEFIDKNRESMVLTYQEQATF